MPDDVDPGGTHLPPPSRVRPGPDAIDPGACPGGVVWHVYDSRNRLLLERKLAPQLADYEIEALAANDLAALDDVVARIRYFGDVYVVMFDGDTGWRMPLPFGSFADLAAQLEQQATRWN